MASTPLVTVGRHDFDVSDPDWSRVHELGPSPIMAFSRTPIVAEFEGAQPVLLNTAIAATPTAGSAYARKPRSRLGHRVVWCQFNNPGALAGAIGERYPAALDQPHAPFPRPAMPASPLAAILARRVADRALQAPTACDPLEIDEAVLVIADLLADAIDATSTNRVRSNSPLARDAVHSTMETIARAFETPPSLTALAGIVGVSPAYLSRVFRNEIGITLSAYTALVRLSEAADRLRDPRCTATQAAYACGFASHAHLTSTCRRVLGVTPKGIAQSHRESLRSMLAFAQTRRPATNATRM